MRLRVASVLFALFAGCTARADIIEFHGLITSGEATYTYSPQRFTATVQGPEMSFALIAGQDPANGVSVGGGTPYCCSGGGSFFADGLSLGCSAYPGSPNCFAEMSINLIDTPTVIGFINGYEIESQPFTASAYLSGCNGPGCGNGSCYTAGTNCFDGYFLGGGTATITLYPPPPNGVYGPYEDVFDFVAIPEPTSIMLAALGLIGIGLARRR